VLSYSHSYGNIRTQETRNNGLVRRNCKILICTPLRNGWIGYGVKEIRKKEATLGTAYIGRLLERKWVSKCWNLRIRTAFITLTWQSFVIMAMNIRVSYTEEIFFTGRETKKCSSSINFYFIMLRQSFIFLSKMRCKDCKISQRTDYEISKEHTRSHQFIFHLTAFAVPFMSPASSYCSFFFCFFCDKPLNY
jgi:hypothetical protein